MEGISLFENTYALLAVIFALVSFVLAIVFSKGRAKKSAAAVYGLLAAVMGLFVGRIVYCAVQFEFMFYDEIGSFAGFAPFFDLQNGSINMGGILLGMLLAAPIAAKITGEKTANLLDSAVFPALLLYSAMRFIEPLSGQGFGEWVENEALWFQPLCITNEWGDWMLSVCFIEGLLTFILAIVLFIFRSRTKCPGTLTRYALFLFCASQVLPQCLRCDSVLFVFIFARVNHIILALALFFVHLTTLLKGKKQGLPGKTVTLEALAMAFGEVLCIGTIFALDKTNLPDILVYIVMVLTLVCMCILACRRIHKEDKPCIAE